MISAGLAKKSTKDKYYQFKVNVTNLRSWKRESLKCGGFKSGSSHGQAKSRSSEKSWGAWPNAPIYLKITTHLVFSSSLARDSMFEDIHISSLEWKPRLGFGNEKNEAVAQVDDSVPAWNWIVKFSNCFILSVSKISSGAFPYPFFSNKSGLVVGFVVLLLVPIKGWGVFRLGVPVWSWGVRV